MTDQIAEKVLIVYVDYLEKSTVSDEHSRTSVV